MRTALFYLRSRAIDAATARNLLIHAFAADVLQRMRLVPVRHYLEAQLTGRLHGTEIPEQGAGAAHDAPKRIPQ